MKTSLNSLLFDGHLVVPTWGDFWKRYLILLCLGVVALGFALYSPMVLLWLQWDHGAGTVTTFGITLQANDVAIDLNTAVNRVYGVTMSVIYCLYILLVVATYGPRRFWRAATNASMKKMSVYVIGIVTIIILGGYLFEWLGIYSGDPKNMRKESIWMIFLGGIVVPITEELFARLTLYQMIRAKTHFLVAAIISSIAFGLLHFGYPEPVKMAMAGLVGVFLCWTYEKTGSIITPIGIHVLNNLWMQLV
jgi:membrane protease YdiL (CAAX protease family)